MFLSRDWDIKHRYKMFTFYPLFWGPEIGYKFSAENLKIKCYVQKTTHLPESKFQKLNTTAARRKDGCRISPKTTRYSLQPRKFLEKQEANMKLRDRPAIKRTAVIECTHVYLDTSLNSNYMLLYAVHR